MPQPHRKPTPEEILDVIRRALGEALLMSLSATTSDRPKAQEVTAAVRQRAWFEIHESEILDDDEIA
jgi:hypothetical protein